MGIPAATAQQGQKKDGKDSKEDGSGSGVPKMGMPMMMPMFGQGMGMPFLGGAGSPSFCVMNQNGQLIPMGQMGMPGMMGQMPGMQGVPMAMQGPNGQTIMMMPMVSPQMMQSAQQSQQSSSTQQPQQAQGLQTMIAGMPMGMMMPGGTGGMQGMMLPQSMMGLLGGAQGQMAMGSASGQPATNTIPGLGFGQGMPMGFMMPQTGQPEQKEKNGNPQAPKSATDPSRRVDSGRKEDKPDNYSSQLG